MQCAICNEAVSMTDSSGGVTSGSFMERYECPNGHVGYISGEASDMPSKWQQRGQVFDA